MNILITGAAGNLGSHLARHIIKTNAADEATGRVPPDVPGLGATSSPRKLKLLIHDKEPPADIAMAPDVTIYRADLAEQATLIEPCQNTDCIVHFAGVLFAPRPEKFLPETNTRYARNIMDAALAAGVKKFILVSFPHVEGESTPGHPARGTLDGHPASVHAQTRLAAEKYLFDACGWGSEQAAGTVPNKAQETLAATTQMTPIALRPGMIYARGILMPDAARWLSRRHLLAVWKKPTWIHLISLPDFLAATETAIEKPEASGIYNLGDDGPLTLQEFLDRAAKVWGRRSPWRAPEWAFFAAGALTEAFAAIFRTQAPLTRDFIRIGMASYTADTSRMKTVLLPVLQYPTLEEGIVLL
ncbi:MAG: NAD-dependent epimerase/dehydratase family protein [Thermoleophilia bacterium]